MARTNKLNSEYAFHIGHQDTIAQLGEFGLSVFRSFGPGQFDPVFRTL